MAAGAALYAVDDTQPAKDTIYCETFDEGDEAWMVCLVPKSLGAG